MADPFTIAFAAAGPKIKADVVAHAIAADGGRAGLVTELVEVGADVGQKLHENVKTLQRAGGDVGERISRDVREGRGVDIREIADTLKTTIREEGARREHLNAQAALDRFRRVEGLARDRVQQMVEKAPELAGRARDLVGGMVQDNKGSADRAFELLGRAAEIAKEKQGVRKLSDLLVAPGGSTSGDSRAAIHAYLAKGLREAA